MDLKGKTAVITGASAGIGLSCAEHLHAAGVNLVLNGQREDRLSEAARRLPGTRTVAGDISAPEMPGRLIEEALSAFGRCDIVLNNAGIMTAGDIASIDIDLVCRMVRVNVEAGFRMAYTAVRHFLSVGEGHLVTTTSVLGQKVRPLAGGYCGTKFALEALTEALRVELSRTRVRVSAVAPGLAMTELHRDWPVHPKDMQNVEHPLTPEDVARCVMFVLQQPEYVNIPRLLLLATEQPV
jgi:NADP-dependent 3-hydroxy acid dehydrogenase YdfG